MGPFSMGSQRKGGNVWLLFSGRIGLLFIRRVLIHQSLYKVYDIPLFQYEREDNRREDLEVVMVTARKGGRTSWPLPVNKK